MYASYDRLPNGSEFKIKQLLWDRAVIYTSHGRSYHRALRVRTPSLPHQRPTLF